MADLETLTLRITEESSKAFSAIDKLSKRLDGLSVAVAKLEVGKLNDLANGLINLNSAIILIKGATSQADYTRIFKQLSTLGNVDTSKMNNLSASLGTLSKALQDIPTTVGVTTGIKDLISAIGKLGGVAVERAITNIPRLEQSLSHLISTFARLPEINHSIIEFINSLSGLASQGQRVGSASNTISNSLERFGTSATRATRRAHSLASTIGTLYAKFWLLMRGAKGLKNAFMDAADYLEAYNYFDVTAKKIGKDTFAKAGVGSAEEYADAFTKTLEEKLHKMSGLELDLEQRLIKTTNAKSLGLNLTELTQYQASIASITNAMGVSQEVAQSTAKAFSMLAGDMGSLRNMDFTQVAQKLQSGLTGQARALYQFGIDITNATLAEYAYANGISKSVSEMSQAEKAQLRLLAILDQSKVSWGDLANTINSPSNQLRMLKTNLKEVGTVFGQLFIPVMQSVLPVLNGLSMAIKQLMVDIAELLGIKLDLDSFGTFGDEVDADVDAVEDLNKAMKETKKSIREFDELKVINNSKDKGSGLGEEIDLTKQIIEATAEYEKVWNEAYAKMRSKASEIAGIIGDALEPVKTIIKDFHVGDYFKAGQDVSKLVTSITGFFTRAIRSVDWKGIGTKIGEFFKGIDWKGVLSGIAELIWAAIQALIDAWTGMFSVAPFETAILTAFAILKYTGLGKSLKENLTKKIKNALTDKGFTKDLASGLGLGALTLGIGIALTVSNIQKIKDAKYTGNSVDSVVTSLVASAIEGAGIAIIAGTLGIATGGVAFAIGTAIALVANLLISDNVTPPPVAHAEKILAEEYKWVDEHHLNNLNVIADIKVTKGNVELEFNTIDELAEKVYNLSVSYNDLTDGEKGLLKYYSDQLIEVMPELAEKIDTVTGAYKGSREELDKLLESQKKQMMLNAYGTNMQKVKEQEASTKKDIHDLEKSKADAEAYIEQFRKDTVEAFMRWGYNGVVAAEAADWIISETKNGSKRAKTNADGTYSFQSGFRGGTSEDVTFDITELTKALATVNQTETSINTLKSDLEEITNEYTYWETEYKKAVNGTVNDTSKDVKGGVKQTGKDINDSITTNGNKAENSIKTTANKINNAFKPLEYGQLPKSMETTLSNVDQKIKNNLPLTEGDMNDLFSAINYSFAGLENGQVPWEMKQTMDEVEKAIRNKSPEIITLMGDLRTQMERLMQGALTMGDNLIYNPNNKSVDLINEFGTLKEGLKNGRNVNTTQLNKMVTTLFKESTFENLPQEVLKALSEVDKTKGADKLLNLENLENTIIKKFTEIGYYIPLGLSNGIMEGNHYYYKALEGISEDGHAIYKKNEGISSPSKVYERLAEYIPEGMAIGLEKGIPKVDKAMKNISDSMASEFGDLKYNIPRINYGSTNVQRFNYGNMDNANSFVNHLVSMANAASEKGQSEVVFRIEGDPYGMFKIVREENNKYKRMHNRSAFT